MKRLSNLVWVAVFAVFPVVSASQQTGSQITTPGQNGSPLSGDFAQHGATRMSCAEIASTVNEALRGRAGMENLQFVTSEELDCATSGHVPQGAALEVKRAFWSSALRRWEFSLRCVHSADCIPFLVCTRSEKAGSVLDANGIRSPLPSGATPMYLPGSTLSSVRVAVVKPGQGATLVWEQGGIRAEFPVICLDRGGIGESVRARVKNGDRILRAEVVSEGRLRATP